MKHKEWLGNKNLIMKLLEKANLNEDENGGERKALMRQIIIYRYLEFMTVEEICAKIMFKYGIELDKSKYYRLFNSALKLIEKYI